MAELPTSTTPCTYVDALHTTVTRWVVVVVVATGSNILLRGLTYTARQRCNTTASAPTATLPALRAACAQASWLSEQASTRQEPQTCIRKSLKGRSPARNQLHLATRPPLSGVHPTQHKMMHGRSISPLPNLFNGISSSSCCSGPLSNVVQTAAGWGQCPVRSNLLAAKLQGRSAQLRRRTAHFGCRLKTHMHIAHSLTKPASPWGSCRCRWEICRYMRVDCVVQQ